MKGSLQKLKLTTLIFLIPTTLFPQEKEKKSVGDLFQDDASCSFFIREESGEGNCLGLLSLVRSSLGEEGGIISVGCFGTDEGKGKEVTLEKKVCTGFLPKISSLFHFQRFLR